eukprot:251597_1
MQRMSIVSPRTLELIILSIAVFVYDLSVADSSGYCKSLLYNGIPMAPLDVCVAGSTSSGSLYGELWECDANNIDIVISQYFDTNCNGIAFNTTIISLAESPFLSAKCDTNLICDYGIGRQDYSYTCKSQDYSFINVAIIINDCWDYHDLIFPPTIANITNTTKSLQITCDPRDGFAVRSYADSGCNAANLSSMESMRTNDQCSSTDSLFWYHDFGKHFQFVSCDSINRDYTGHVCNVNDAEMNVYYMGEIHCGESITAYLNDSCTYHDYAFNVNYKSHVSITSDTCGSDFDTVLDFYDADWTFLGGCADHDDVSESECTHCTPYRGKGNAIFKFSEIYAGLYYLSIFGHGLFDYGEYNLTLQCEYHSSCDWFTGDVITLQEGRLLTAEISVNNDIFAMEFDIQLHALCVAQTCNIVHIGNAPDFGALKFSINGSNDYWIVQMGDTIHQIANDKTMLSVDAYHNVKLSLVNSSLFFEFDHVTQAAVSITPFPHEDQYALYASNPWDIALNATITNLCINTTDPHMLCCECLEYRPLPGCPLDAKCEANVCFEDSFCCDKPLGNWDDTCVDRASRIADLNHCPSPTPLPTPLPTSFVPTFDEEMCDIYHSWSVITLNNSFDAIYWSGASYSNTIAAKETFEMQFDIRLLSKCGDHSLCNLLHFGQSSDVGLPMISVNGSNDYFVISVTTNDPNSGNVFQINDTDAILRNDDTWHRIRLRLTNNDLLFQFDDYTFYFNSSDYPFYRSKYLLDTPLYASSPWMNPLIATITNLCINSSTSDTYDIVNSTNYHLVTKPLSWTDAELFCEHQFGTSLAVMTQDMAVQDAWSLRDNLGANIKETNAWMGLNALEMDGNWTWYGNVSCNYVVSNNCVDDSHWQHSMDSNGQGDCGYLMGGDHPLNSSFHMQNCSMYNPFLCDRFNQYESFSDAIAERSASNCKYYHEDEISAYTTTMSELEVFPKITFVTELFLSFDFKININSDIDCVVCDILHLDASHWQREFTLYMDLSVGRLVFEMGEYVQRLDDLLIAVLDDAYHRIDLLFTNSYQVLKLNNRTYFMEWNHFEYFRMPDAYLGQTLYLLSESLTSIKNVCINSDSVALPSLFCDDYLTENVSGPEWYEFKVTSDLPIQVRFEFCGFNMSDSVEITVYHENGINRYCDCSFGCSWNYPDHVKPQLPFLLFKGHYLVEINAPSSEEYEVFLFCDYTIDDTLSCNDSVTEYSVDINDPVHYYTISVPNGVDLFEIGSCNISGYVEGSVYVANTNFSIIDMFEMPFDWDTYCQFIRLLPTITGTELIVGIKTDYMWDSKGFIVNIQCHVVDYDPIPDWRSQLDCNRPSIDASDYVLEFDSITVQGEYQIGWVKMMTCAEGIDSDFVLNERYNMTDIEALLPNIISVKIAPPGNAWTNLKYDDFVVETVPCSDAIFAINRMKEMSVSLHQLNFTITDINDDTDWIGSDTAKQRLSGGSQCYSYVNPNDFARDFTILYENCDGGMHLNMKTGKCLWNDE